MKTATEPERDTVAEARRLLDMWENLSRQHVSMGAACACGAGGITLQLQDFERDIIDYLVGKSERGGRTDVIAFIQANAAGDAEGSWSVSSLLGALADEDPAARPAPEVSQMLLENLGRTLTSFAKLHG